MNLCHLFDLSLVGRRECVALEFQGRTYTFGELDSRSNRVARLLMHKGFAKGDRVCVYLANCVEMIDLYLACVKTGVIFVPVNILYRDREITHIVADAEPREFVSDPEWVRKADALEDSRPAVVCEGDDPAGIIYTSGTTGASKGAVLTHNNFAANAVNLLACWQITGEDRLLLGSAAVSRARAGERAALLADQRLPHASAGALRTSEGGGGVSEFPADAVFWRADDLCAAAGVRCGRSAGDRGVYAAVRIGLGALARAGVRRVPRALRAHHPGALRHERNADESQQSL